MAAIDVVQEINFVLGVVASGVIGLMQAVFYAFLANYSGKNSVIISITTVK